MNKLTMNKMHLKWITTFIDVMSLMRNYNDYIARMHLFLLSNNPRQTI